MMLGCRRIESHLKGGRHFVHGKKKINSAKYLALMRNEYCLIRLASMVEVRERQERLESWTSDVAMVFNAQCVSYVLRDNER